MAIDSNYKINSGSIFLTSETANSIIDPKEEEKANTFLSRGDGSSGINFIESFLERPATSIVEDEEEKIKIKEDHKKTKEFYTAKKSNFNQQITASITLNNQVLSGYVWPITIANTSSQDTLTITLEEDISLDSSNEYFIINSSKIRIEGNDHKIFVDGVQLYPGLFRNGSAQANGFDDILIEDINVVSLNNSSLAGTNGWLGQRYFGKNASNVSIEKSSSEGLIPSNSGGIVGANSKVRLDLCFSTGSILADAGGLVGPESIVDIISSYSTGAIMGRSASGLVAGNSQGTISRSYTTGNSSEAYTSGIAGSGFAGEITLCYSTGTIGREGGGIVGSSSTARINNSYSSGNINVYAGGIAAIGFLGEITACYSTGVVGREGGGIVGAGSSGIVKNSFSTGEVSIYAGSIFGIASQGKIINSYSSGELKAAPEGVYGMFGAGKLDGAIITNSKFDPAYTWNFDNAIQYLEGTDGSVWTFPDFDNLNLPFKLAAFFQTLPLLETSEAASVSSGSALLRGNLLNTGGLAVTEIGFIWSTDSLFATENQFALNVSDPIDFSYSVESLSPNTTYFFKGYAKNSLGTSIGEIRSFTTTPKDASTLTIDAIADETYTGTDLTPAVVVKDGNTTLTLDTDYTVAYTDNTNVGTATVTISGIGNYTGTTTQTFTIVAKDASTLTIEAIANQIYTGADLTPAVVVKDGATTLTLGTDYNVAYTDNRIAGTATVTITGAGNYTGTKTQTFNIDSTNFSLANNGLTCLCPNASPGDKGFVGGVEFEAVDNALIRQRRDEGVDMTKLCTSLVTDMSNLFIGKQFNQSIENWDVNNVTTMKEMFVGSSFNQPIGNWEVGNVTNMVEMFAGSSFNQPIGNWDVSNVTDMAGMFDGNLVFNQSLETWNVENVLNMQSMFKLTPFNLPIANWNVRNVTIMDYMFEGSNFNQNISDWCVSQFTTEPISFSNNGQLQNVNKPIWGTCPVDTLTIDPIADETYTGTDLTPAVVVKDGNTTLTLDTDYEVDYTDNRNVGTATATITGVGNYTGTKTQTFTIVAKDASTLTIEAIADETYTGAPLTPAVVVKDGATTLTLGTDYNVAYTDNTNVGTATVTITGAGNYTGTTTQTFSIEAKNASTLTIEAIANQTYTGADLTPAVVVKDIDFPREGLIAWYPFNGNANDESGNGNNGLVVGPTLTTNRTGESNSAYLFDGANDYINVSPALSGLNSLSEITISTWIYKDGAGLGTYFSHWIDNGQPTTPIGITQAINSSDKFTVAMIGGQQTSSQSSISLNDWNNITLVFNGSSQSGSKLKLYVNGVFIENMPDTNIPLTSGTVANRTYIGANASFPDNFNNSIYQYFKGKIDDLGIWNRALTAEEISNIHSSTTTLTLGTDYTVDYTDNTNVGTATVTVTGTANYTGTKTQTFTIVAKDASTLTIEAIANQIYTGTDLTPAVVVKDGNTTLTLGTDYNVAYTDNTNVGTATVTVTGAGNYTGTTTQTFTIVTLNSTVSISSNLSEVGEGESVVISASIDAVNTKDVLIYPAFSGSALLGVDYTVAFESKGLELVAGGNGRGNTATQLNGPAPIVTFISEAEQAIYIADASSGRVIKWGFGAQTGEILINNPDVQTITDIYVDEDKNIYLVEQNASVVSKWLYPNYSQRQVLAGRLRENGSDANLLHSPNSFQVIEKDNQVQIFISDSQNHRVQKWVVGQNQGTTVAGGNGSGSTANQLFDPRKIWVDEESNVFVLDSRNSRIQKWVIGASQGETVYQGNQSSVINDFDRDEEGNWYLINLWPSINLTKYSPDFNKQYLLADGSMDSPYAFDNPTSIRVDAYGDAYIGDSDNFWVVKYNNTPKFKIPAGQTTATITLTAIDNDQFDGERSINVAVGAGLNIDFDPSQNLLISIDENDTPDPVVSLSTSIQEVEEGDSFNLTASLSEVSTRDAFINMSFGGAAELDVDFKIDFPTQGPRIVAGGNGAGSQLNQLGNPRAVTVGPDGAIYTADENSQLAKWTPGKTEKEILPYTVNLVRDLHVDKDNNLYVLDEATHRVIKFTPGSNNGTTVAGNRNGERGASASRFDVPLSLFVDDQGAMYVADHSNHRVQKWAPGATQGITVAGGNGEGSGPTQLRSPRAVTVGKDGAIYVSDANNQVTKWLPGKAEKEVLPFNSNDFWDIDVDENDNLYLLERWTHTLVKYAKGSSERIILAGKNDGSSGSSLDRLNDAWKFYLDKSKNIFIADRQNNRVVKYQVSPEIVIPKGQLTGGIVVETLKDDRYEGNKSIQISVSDGLNIEFDANDSTSVLILEIDTPDPIVSISSSLTELEEGGQFDITATLETVSSRDALIGLSFVGTAEFDQDYTVAFPSKGPKVVAGGNGDGNDLNQTRRPRAVAVGKDGSVYVSEEESWRLSRWYPGKAEKEILNINTQGSRAIHVDQDDNIYVLEEWGHKLVKYPARSTEGIVIAGEPGNQSGDAMNRLNNAQGLFIADNGDIYIADQNNHRIQKWAQGATQGVTVAGGNGEGRASNQLSYPRTVTVDSQGKIYVSDNFGLITRWTPGKSERENLQIPTNGARGLYVDKADNLFVLEEWGHKLVKYASGTTVGVVIAGNANGQSGNGITRLNNPQGIALDALGNVYIADQGNNRVVKYQLAPEILIPAGQTSGSVTLTTTEDVSYEEDEAIEIQIIGGKSIEFDSNQKVTTKILDNDQAPEITFALSSDRLQEAATDSVFLTAKTKTIAGKDIEVFLSVSDDSDTGAEKYEISSLSILIAAGDSISSVSLKPSDYDDDQVDVLRKIVLSVDSVRNGFSAEENIVIFYESNDDPSFEIEASESEVAEHLSFDLTATLSAISSRDALIGVSILGSAKFDVDYTVNFPSKGPSIVAGGNGEGNDLDQTRRPRAVAVGKDGSVYVSEEGNWQLSKWSPGKAEKQVLNINTNGGRAIHVDQDDNIYVLEEWGHKLVKYPAGSTQGTVIAGDPGNQSGDALNRLSNAQGFFIADNGDIYIADQNNHRIQKWVKGATQGVTVAGGNGDGNGLNQLGYPRTVTVDSNGRIYVSDNSGQITRWTPGKSERENLQIPSNGARGLYIDKANNLFVLEEWGNKLSKYDLVTKQRIVIAGDANGQSGNSIARLNNPQSLALDALGNVYIADQGNNRVVKYQFAPEILIPAGSTSASIKVDLIDDDINEANETIKVIGKNYLNTFPIVQDSVKVNILDNSKSMALKDAPFIGLSNGAVAWGDFDRDGDMDVAVMGVSPTSGAVTRLYENKDGIFVDTNQNFARYFDGDISWVDLNKDGWIDLVVSGLSNNKPDTKVYLNIEGRFFEESVSYGLPKLFSTKIAWGDLDNDGDIDLAIAGIDESDKYIFGVYYKDDLDEKYTIEPEFLPNNNFNGVGESGFINGDLKIIDVDLDGDNDIVYSGENKSGAPIGGIVTNTYIRSGQFSMNQNFSNDENRLRLGLKNSALVIDKLSASDTLSQLGIIAMGEDSEGKLYFTSSVQLQEIAINSSGNFSKLKNGSVALGDLNNDGLLDLVQAGEDDKGIPESKIFLQRKSSDVTFELWDINLIGLRESTINLVDYDMDGDLDLFLTGLDKDGLPRSILYESVIKNKSNAAPEKVEGLKFEDLGNGNVRFSWDSAKDDYSKNLGYNLRLGLSPGGDELSNVESDLATGYRLISKPATIYKNTFETQLDPGIYYWSVQAVDDGLLGGEFSEESGFTLVYEWKILNQGGIVDRNIQGLESPVIKLGDLDGDGDLDLIYGSAKSGNVSVFKFDEKRMVRDNKSPINADRIVNAEVGDINGDGVLDILVSNFSFNGSFNFKIYISQPNGDYQVKDEQSLFNAKGKIVDLNNDGQSEVVISGLSSSTGQGLPRIFIYEYEGDGLPFKKTDISSQIAQLTGSAFDLGDFDNDQDIDYTLTGFSSDGLRSYIYENTTALGGSFKLTQTANNIVPVRDGTIDFIDFDGDGDLDIIVTGTGANGDVFEVYINKLNQSGSQWSRINVGLTAIRNGKIDLGDFNGDGYADLLYSGVVQGQGKVTELAEFDPVNLKYRESNFDVSDITDAEVEFGDVDGDGDLDFIISGNSRGFVNQYLLRGYINVRSESAKVLERQAGLLVFNSFDLGLSDPNFARLTDSPIDDFRLEAQTDFVVNNPPSIPEIAEVKILTGLALPNNKKAVELAWEASLDDHTPSQGLTYALRLGTSPNGEDILSSNASQDGWRNTPGKGNAEHNLKWKLSLNPGTYYWSVQAIDASYAGSKFSQEGSFVLSASGVNSAPKLETGVLDLIEFSKVGTKIGTLNGSDTENHSFKWSIYSGNEKNLFSIDSLSGDIFVADQFAMDFNLHPSFELQIKITDELGAASINTLIINLIEDADTDGDGVKNNLDLCPGTIAGEEVDEFGCSSTQGTLQLKLKNIVVKLDSTGKAQVNSSDVDNGSLHPLPNVTFELRLAKTNFNCTNLGLNTVEVTAEDSRGKVEKRFVEIVVLDDSKPTLKAKSAYTIKLDAVGKATLKWEDIDEGSTDNCSIKTRTLSKTSFTCSDLGSSKIVFTVKDGSGNTSNSEVTVTVIDETKPTVKSKSAYTIKLDAEGKAALKWEDIDEGSTDNCSIKDRTLSKTSFTCADLGSSKIVFTVKDGSGNTSNSEVTITVVDETKPTLKAKSAYTIKLDAEGKAALKWEDIDEGSTDNCSINDRTLSKTSFTCADLGDSKISFTVKDASGNTSIAEITVTVVDEIKPNLKAKSSYTIKLDSQGKATLKWEDIDEGSTDNCSIKERKLSKTDFTRTDGGDNKVTYTITDANGNTSSIETTVRLDVVLSAPERANQGNSIKAYPNPVSDYLYLEFAEGISISAIRGSSLVDASGRIIGEIRLEEGGAGQLGFSTRELKAGMYFLRLSTRDTLHLIKFTVIH